MKKKRMLYSILFSLWIGSNYLNVWGNLSWDMADHLTFNSGDEPILLTTFQHWVLAGFSVIYDSIFIAIAVGIFAYHHREYKPWSYILLGLSIRYFVVFLFLSLSLYRHSLSSIIDTILALADREDYILGTIHLVFAIPASYAGMSIGRDAKYLDEKDEQLGYLAGCSKKLWVLLTLAYNPVVRLATKVSIIHVLNLSKMVSSFDWGSLIFLGDDGSFYGLILNLMFLAIIWMLTFYLFYFGVATIRDKEAKYRRVKIIAIFVVVPVLVIGIHTTFAF